MIYTVTFNPALDYVMQVDSMVLGQVNRSTCENVYIGGKGINVSVVLRELGHESIALGYTAGFTGKAIEDGLKKMQITSDLIPLERGVSRNNIKLKGDEETEINALGPGVSKNDFDKLLKKLENLVAGDVLVLAGSIPGDVPSNTYEDIMERLNGKGIRVIVDATKELLRKVLKYGPFLIKPNTYEISEIFKKELKTDEELIEHGKKLQEMGAKNVLISKAGDGAILISEIGEVYHIGVPKGTVKNSVGAGDSMVAGFLAGYLDTGDYRHALCMGTAAGSATAFSEGLATRDKIEELFKSIQTK